MKATTTKRYEVRNAGDDAVRSRDPTEMVVVTRPMLDTQIYP